MNQTTTNRLIRKAFRKRLLPQVERCLLGRATPIASHHMRHELDRQSAAEILACFEGMHGWLNNQTTDDLLTSWHTWKLHQKFRENDSIGDFCLHLYENQVAHDANVYDSWSGDSDEPKPSMLEQHERRTHLMATLYIAGYLPSFEPEELPVN